VTALRQADWVAKDRVAAAVTGPCAEVLRTIAVQPLKPSSARLALSGAVPVPATRCCPACGALRA